LRVDAFRLNNLDITLDKQGASRFAKVSYPIRYGRFCEIKSSQYLFQFNLNGEIKYIRGCGPNWPHPAEWLKRTDSDDWVFYTIAGYNRIFDTLGEYYLPCLPYASNSIWGYNPFADSSIREALAAWPQLLHALRSMGNNSLPAGIKNFLELASRQDARALQKKSKKLHSIIGGQVSVLPPDTRHVDYEVIPLMIADGCLYQCRFCCFKSRRRFQTRSEKNILAQIRNLKSLYGADLANYSAVFLGNHDALAAGKTSICLAAAEAYQTFEFEKAHVKDARLFLFGSVGALLKAGPQLFEYLNRTPFYTCINIGLESADAATLSQIDKPLEISEIEDAFQKMLDVNRSYLNIEITANFIIGDRLSPDHYRSIMELICNRLDRFYSKGGIYLSPLNTSRNYRDLLRTFFEIKNLSRLPTNLYLIQRL
jgi:hypothetical protein